MENQCFHRCSSVFIGVPKSVLFELLHFGANILPVGQLAPLCFIPAFLNPGRNLAAVVSQQCANRGPGCLPSPSKSGRELVEELLRGIGAGGDGGAHRPAVARNLNGFEERGQFGLAGFGSGGQRDGGAHRFLHLAGRIGRAAERGGRKLDLRIQPSGDGGEFGIAEQPIQVGGVAAQRQCNAALGHDPDLGSGRNGGGARDEAGYAGLAGPVLGRGGLEGAGVAGDGEIGGQQGGVGRRLVERAARDGEQIPAVGCQHQVARFAVRFEEQHGGRRKLGIEGGRAEAVQIEPGEEGGGGRRAGGHRGIDSGRRSGTAGDGEGEQRSGGEMGASHFHARSRTRRTASGSRTINFRTHTAVSKPAGQTRSQRPR